MELQKQKIKRIKKFAQYFLTNEEILNLEAELLDPKEKEVLEIGAGDGRLSEKILQHQPKKLILVEIDKRFCFELKKKFSNLKNVEVLNQDFLDLKIKRIDIITGNAPYNISSLIILKLREIKFDYALLLLQKEFVDRLIAQPSTSNYGRLSAMAEAYFNVEPLKIVKKENFFPIPKVDSQFVKIIRKKNPSLEKNFEKISAALFSHRLASVKNALFHSRKIFGWKKEEAKEIIKKLKNREKKVFMLSWQEINEIAKIIREKQ
ncbi:MAG: 16S rRNA (adenine(1518)-N(6)/adenine(1519)-N(6))-dimethyltransferase RsmA [Candidatus Anstonellaceae archaeon]